MIRNLENKVVWITGAGSGIGQDAAIKLSKLGMKVILSGRNIQTLQDTASKCDKDTMIKPVDISDKQSVRDLIYALKSEIEHIDVLVNCAGINIEKRDWDNIDENEWFHIGTVKDLKDFKENYCE